LGKTENLFASWTKSVPINTNRPAHCHEFPIDVMNPDEETESIPIDQDAASDGNEQGRDSPLDSLP
jgi:hypothetical protein